MSWDLFDKLMMQKQFMLIIIIINSLNAMTSVCLTIIGRLNYGVEIAFVAS